MYYSNQVEGHKGIFHRVERELTTVVLVYQPTVLFPLRKVFSHPVAIALKVLDFPLKDLRPPPILEEFKVVWPDNFRTRGSLLISMKRYFHLSLFSYRFTGWSEANWYFWNGYYTFMGKLREKNQTKSFNGTKTIFEIML